MEEARENRFKKLKRLTNREDQDEDDGLETINKKLKTEKNQPIVFEKSENFYDFDSGDDSTNEKRKMNQTDKEAVPKRQVHRREKKSSQFDVALNRLEENKAKRIDPKTMEEEKSNSLIPFSLHDKNTTDSEKFDSDENNSPFKSDNSQASSERTRLKRLKKLLDPNETKESIEEEEIKDEPECPICLSKIEKESARINCCNHIFCFDCIKDWSERANQCPLCKKRFSKIQKYSRSGVKLGEVRTKFKDQEFEEPEFEVIENTDEACYECGSASDMQRLLVCDECHFYCCHTYCCSPPLRRVPIDPWYCNFCRPENVNEGRGVNRDRGTAQRDHTNRNRGQRRPAESPPRRNNLNRSNTTRSNESAVTQSIRNSLPDDSFLKQLFDAVDQEQENKRVSKKKRILDEDSIFKKYKKGEGDQDEAKRRRSKSTKKRTSRKTESSKERSRSKSAKSKKAVRRTSKSKPKSRSAKRTGDKKKKPAKKKVVTKRNK